MDRAPASGAGCDSSILSRRILINESVDFLARVENAGFAGPVSAESGTPSYRLTKGALCLLTGKGAF